MDDEQTERYCLFCEKPGHLTSACHSTQGLNTPRDREMFRLVARLPMDMLEAGWVCCDGFPALLGSKPLKPGAKLYANPDAWHEA